MLLTFALAYVTPAIDPMQMNIARLDVNGSLKTITPRIDNGILLAAPTIDVVVGEVADIHQNMENPIPKPMNAERNKVTNFKLSIL